MNAADGTPRGTLPGALLDALPAHIAIVDAQGRITAVNRAWRQFARDNGLTDDALGPGQDYLAVCDAARPGQSPEAGAVGEALRDILAGRRSGFTIEYPCHSPTAFRWFLLTITPLDSPDGGAVLAHTDISARRTAEQALAASEARFRAAFEQAAVGVAHVAADGRILDVNDHLCGITGYARDELRGMTIRDLTLAEDLAQTQAARQALLSGTRQSMQLEKRCRRKSGEPMWVNMAVTVVRDAAREPYFITIMEDITARKRAEAAMARSRDQLRMASRLGRIGAWEVELATATVTWSDEVRSIHEVPAGYVPTVETGLDFYAPECRGAITAAFNACVEHGRPFDLEVEIITTGGQRVWVRSIGEAVRAADGAIIRVQGAFQDISERRRAAAETEQLAERFRITLESITDAFYTLDREWRFTYLNHQAELGLGRSRDQLLGRSLWAEFPAIAGTVFHEIFTRAMTEGTAQHALDYYAEFDGWFDVRIYPSSQGLAVTFRDITEQHRSAELLAEQAALLDEARDAISVRDLQQRTTYWNRSAERLYGWSAAEAVGRPVRDLLYPDSTAFDLAVAEVVARGEWVGELSPVAKDGRRLLVEGHWTLVRDPAGRPRAILAISTDITERRRLEQQFLRVQRLESIGTLAGGIAHDLNNVLTPIMLANELLTKYETDPKRLQSLAIIEASAQRGADMVRQVLAFARGVEGQHLPVNIPQLMRELGTIINDTFLKTVQVRMAVPEELWTVVGDPTQLHQVLLNLCVNARDAMPDGGTLTLTAENRQLDDRYAELHIEARPGPYVVLSVEDTGTGMPPEVVEKIYEPFFTTKELGKGTGLGLSTSLALVRSHGGFLLVYSEPGTGTIFKVHLPAQAASAGEVARSTVAVPHGHGELVLVVDDEPMVRQTTRQALEAFGYRVVVAADGGEAVALFAMQQEEIALVVTDMMMPVMDGNATIRVLLRIRPGLPIIAASGLNENQVVAKAISSGVRHFLSKPYTAETLLTRVHEALQPLG